VCLVAAGINGCATGVRDACGNLSSGRSSRQWGSAERSREQCCQTPGAAASLRVREIELACGLSSTEREGFEPSTEVASCNSLAGSRFQPLSHLSSGSRSLPERTGLLARWASRSEGARTPGLLLGALAGEWGEAIPVLCARVCRPRARLVPRDGRSPTPQGAALGCGRQSSTVPSQDATTSCR
jgi:hypothetical protein